MRRTKRKTKRWPRASKAEIAARVEEILVCRLNGAMHYDLVALAKEKGWEVSPRQLFRYMQQADALLSKSLESERQQIVARHVCQRRNLYARSLQDGEWRTCLAILDSEAALLGLQPSKKLEMTGKDGAPIYPTLETMVAAIMEAEKRGAPDDASDNDAPNPRDGTPAAGSEAEP